MFYEQRGGTLRRSSVERNGAPAVAGVMSKSRFFDLYYKQVRWGMVWRKQTNPRWLYGSEALKCLQSAPRLEVAILEYSTATSDPGLCACMRAVRHVT